MRIVRHRREAVRSALSATRTIAPGVVPLLAAHHLGSDIDVVVDDLAMGYARRGESLETCVEDLEACFEAIGQAPMTDAMVRSASVAWGDAYAGRFAHISCRDEQSGFSSVHHLQSHIQRLPTSRTQPGRLGLRAIYPQATHHVLLVAELEAEHASPTQMSIVNDELRAATTHATMFVALTNRRSAALMRRTQDLAMLVRRLDHAIAERITVTPAYPRPRVWIEGLPDHRAAAADMVGELSR